MIKDKLKVLRESQGFSRKEFCKIIDCSLSHVINLETGAARLSQDHKAILCDHFDLSDEYFGSLDPKVPITTSEYDCAIGRNVAYYRKKNGMTQGVLAEELGYSKASSISAVERGQKPIGKKKIIELAKIFDIHVSELFTTDDISMSSDEDALLNKFIYLVRLEKKPSVYGAIKQLIEAGCDEIKKTVVE